MKKVIASFFVFFTCVFFSFAKNKPVSFDVGLSTGIPTYGSEEISDLTDSFMEQKNGSHVIIGLTGDFKWNMSDIFTLFCGSDLLFDSVSNTNNEFYSHLDYSFFTGLKFYPNLAGLNFSIAYVLGNRTDFMDYDSWTISSARIKGTEVQSWGNGLRLSLEYDFSHNSSYSFLPSLGVYWRYLPRGNNFYDNYVCVYALLNF